MMRRLLLALAFVLGIAGTSSPTFGGSSQNFSSAGGHERLADQYDGVQFVSAGTLNATAHTFTPQGGATCGGTDITGTFPNCTLVTSTNPNVGTFGSSTLIPVITANNKGPITALTTASVSVAAPNANSLTGTALASNVVASSFTSVGTLTGGATGAGFTVALGPRQSLGRAWCTI